jgi:hypothetical protein
VVFVLELEKFAILSAICIFSWSSEVSLGTSVWFPIGVSVWFPPVWFAITSLSISPGGADRWGSGGLVGGNVGPVGGSGGPIGDSEFLPLL